MPDANRREVAATTTDAAELRRLRKMRERKIALYSLTAIALLSAFFAGRAGYLGEWAVLFLGGEPVPVEPPGIIMEPPAPADLRAPMEKALTAKAVYLTMDSAGTPSIMRSIMEFVRGHDGLNSFVIDVKDNSGRVPTTPPENVPALPAHYPHFPALVSVLHDQDYYMIARIVAFQDPYRAKAEPERAIRNADGSLWRARDGMIWLNPYDRKNWEYVRDVALWALDMGFDEIQLDYVRFPDNSRGMETSGSVLMPGHSEFNGRGDAIAAFLKYMSEEIGDRAYLGADIFGFVTIAVDDMGIGQKLEEVADSVDFICPMVYPSHYFNAGIYGFQVPEAHPKEVVSKAMDEAQERTAGLRSKIRPWLQDFSMRIKYGPAEVRGQIEALFEHGIETYMLWNPGNRYTDGVQYTK
ncbi:MAG: putative glycoside hydrolase [Bacillota bacterium]